jgi:hypothetical protein
MDWLVLLRRVSEYFRFVLRRREPNGRSRAVKIEHDLRSARFAGIQTNPPDLIETQTRWHRPNLRRRLLYLGATSHSGQSRPCDQRFQQELFHTTDQNTAPH